MEDKPKVEIELNSFSRYFPKKEVREVVAKYLKSQGWKLWGASGTEYRFNNRDSVNISSSPRNCGTV